MQIRYSFIIPVFNRPEEVRELFRSMLKLEPAPEYEIVLVEDGSTQTCEEVVKEFQERLPIRYFQKPNSGPGKSRNYGMSYARGDYFLILDSDVLLPPHYLAEVERELQKEHVACFGGPDAAHQDFSDLQKAINYSMTSLLTTGGIRGRKIQEGSFEPRSFNMGLARELFERTEGFYDIHPGEDPELVWRIKKSGYSIRLFPGAFVYHKRRISWKKFYNQVYKFGMVRPILSKWHPASRKITYWFPSVFTMGLFLAVLLGLMDYYWLLSLYLIYFVMLFIDSSYQTRSIKIGLMGMLASLIQFVGYGLGFCKSSFYIRLLKQDPRKRFPHLFF